MAAKKKLSQVIAELPKFYSYKDKVDYKWELQDKILLASKKEFKGKKVEKIDGVKIWTDDTTWILFRSSQNAPEFRVFTESDSEKKAIELSKQGILFVKRFINK